MPNRVLRDWTTSDSMNRLSPGAEVFFTRLIMKADDYGSFHGNPKLINAALFPLKDYSASEVGEWLRECLECRLVTHYQSDGKDYIRIENFGQRLRAMRNIFPQPADNSLTSGGHVADNSPPETKRNEVETKQETKEKFSHNHDFNKTFADLTNTPYSLPAERGMDPVGRTTDEVVMQLRKTGFSEGEIYSRTRAMKSVYRKQKLTFPSRPETFIISFTAKDWIKELTGMDPEIAAEQFQKNLKDETRRTEPDTIGSSEPGSLG